MNLKIVSGVCIAFVISFGMLYVAINLSENSDRVDYKTEFFSNQVEISKNKILLLGSSHIGHLNMSHIITQIENENLDFTVYNLADNGDSPKFRYNDLEQIINLEPKIVFYGISYRDFDQSIGSTDSKTNNSDIKKRMVKVQEIDSVFEKEISEWIKKNKAKAAKYNLIKALPKKNGVNILQRSIRVATMGRLSEMNAIKWMIDSEGKSYFLTPGKSSQKISQ